MPHFFLPINWLMTPMILILSVIMIMSMIFFSFMPMSFPEMKINSNKNLSKVSWKKINNFNTEAKSIMLLM